MARHIVIIGSGIIGLATAYKLLLGFPGVKVTLLEKESGPARHQSGHNSGVIHAGLHYKPGSLKARLSGAGRREMEEFCQQHHVPYEICGKLVVATNEAEVQRLKQLQEHGTANGLRDLRLLHGRELTEIEPNAAGIAALHVKEEGIVDYHQVCLELIREIDQLGGTIHFGSRARMIRPVAQGWVVTTDSREVEGEYLINCGGLYSDRIAKLAGEHPTTQIVPFRGEYYKLRPERTSLVRNLIYPVPHPEFPFLGVHFTRSIYRDVLAGPNAVLAFAREGYQKYDIDAFELLETLTFPGLWKFIFTHRSMCWAEYRRSGNRESFCAELQKLVPAVRSEDLIPGGAGVRAQAMAADGTLVQDFEIIQRSTALHVINAPSPGATASLAIAGELIRMMGTPSN